MTGDTISTSQSESRAAEEKANRRAFLGHVATTGFAIIATTVAFRRGRRLGFKNLFNSVSAPKDFVYIGFLYGAGDVSQQLVTQARRCETYTEWERNVRGIITVADWGLPLMGEGF